MRKCNLQLPKILFRVKTADRIFFPSQQRETYMYTQCNGKPTVSCHEFAFAEGEKKEEKKKAAEKRPGARGAIRRCNFTKGPQFNAVRFESKEVYD